MVKDYLAIPPTPPGPGGGSAPPSPSVLPWLNHGLIPGDDLFKVLSSMTNSTALALLELDAVECLHVVSAIYPLIFPSPVPATPFDGSAHDEMLLTAISSHLLIIRSKLGKLPAAAVPTHWSPDASRLGKSLAGLLRAPPLHTPSPSHPLAKIFLDKASSAADSESFLESSVGITFPFNRQVWAAAQSSYVWMGALQSFLSKGGPLSDAAVLNLLPPDMNSAHLSSSLYELDEAISNHTASLAPPPPPPPSSSMGPGGALPFQIHVNMDAMQSSTNGKQVSETDKRSLNQLRLDADYISRTPSAMLILEKLIGIKNLNDPEMLNDAVLNITNEQILRLIHTELDVSAALKGGHESLSASLFNLRGVLERRLELAVLGDRRSAIPQSDRLVRAFRAVKRGKLSQVRLFHTIDKDDSGTAEQPLKQLHSIQDRAKAVVLLGEAFNRLRDILSVAFPKSLSRLMRFLPLLFERISKLILLSVPWAKVNKYLRTIFVLMSSRASKNDLSQISWSDAGPEYNESWLTDTSEFHDDMIEAIMDAKVEAGKPGQDKSKRQVDTTGDDKKSKKLKTTTDGKKPAGGNKLVWVQKGEPLLPEANGKFKSVPGRGHQILIDWNKKNGAVRKCWAHANFEGGCPHASCTQPH